MRLDMTVLRMRMRNEKKKKLELDSERSQCHSKVDSILRGTANYWIP